VATGRIDDDEAKGDAGAGISACSAPGRVGRDRDITNRMAAMATAAINQIRDLLRLMLRISVIDTRILG